MTTRDAKPDAHDITCRQAVGLMTDYLDGALGPDDVPSWRLISANARAAPSTCGRSASPSRSPAGSARMNWTRRRARTSWTSTAAGSATGNLKEP